MKASTPELIALLATNQFVFADLYTITLLSGTVLRYTAVEGGITYGGNTFDQRDIYRDRVRTVVGIQVDSMNVSLFANVTDLIQSVPYPQFASNGGFDGAWMRVDRVFMPTFVDAPVGFVNVFTGRISDVVPSRTEVKFTVQSALELLNIQMPRNVYSPNCTHDVYSAGCGANKASFGANSAANSGSTKSLLLCSLAQAAGYFDTGTITFTSGQNAGATRTIKSYTSGVVNLSLPLPYTPAIGDTFTAYAGCDKSFATCSAKFNRAISFRGFPFIPTPETGL